MAVGTLTAIAIGAGVLATGAAGAAIGSAASKPKKRQSVFPVGQGSSQQTRQQAAALRLNQTAGGAAGQQLQQGDFRSKRQIFGN